MNSNECEECLDNNYKLNGGCCEEGKYYDAILRLCLDI